MTTTDLALPDVHNYFTFENIPVLSWCYSHDKPIVNQYEDVSIDRD